MDENGEVIVPHVFGMTTTYPEWRDSDGNLRLTQYTDMYNLGEMLRVLWSDVYTHSEFTLTDSVAPAVFKILKEISPNFGAPFSKLTAAAAYDRFHALYQQPA